MVFSTCHSTFSPWGQIKHTGLSVSHQKHSKPAYIGLIAVKASILLLRTLPSLRLAFISPSWLVLNSKYDLISRSIAPFSLIGALKWCFTPMAALGKGQIINIWPQFTVAGNVWATTACAANVGRRPRPSSAAVNIYFSCRAVWGATCVWRQMSVTNSWL